ncbi:hypothetical protein [Hyalangium gracile]|nr:hypothetical protein [Hyalangium gracile]
MLVTVASARVFRWIVISVTLRSIPLRQGKHDLIAGGSRVVRIRVG